MRAVWSDHHRFELWLRIEILACEAWAELGRIPASALPKIRAATFEEDRIAEIDRAKTRLERATDEVAVGRVSGAVGTHATIDPRVEEHVCRQLGLRPDAVSTQVIA